MFRFSNSLTGLTKKSDQLEREKENIYKWLKDSNLMDHYQSTKDDTGSLNKRPGVQKETTVRSGGAVVSAVGRMEKPSPKRHKEPNGTYAEEVFLFEDSSHKAYASPVQNTTEIERDSESNGNERNYEDDDDISVDDEDQYDNDWFDNEGAGMQDEGAMKEGITTTLYSNYGATGSAAIPRDGMSCSDVVNLGTSAIVLRDTMDTAASSMCDPTNAMKESSYETSVSSKVRYMNDNSCDNSGHNENHEAVNSTKKVTSASKEGTADHEFQRSSGISSGRVETVKQDGTRVITYRNGTKKEV